MVTDSVHHGRAAHNRILKRRPIRSTGLTYHDTTRRSMASDFSLLEKAKSQ